MIIQIDCTVCANSYNVAVNSIDYKRWNNKEVLIQDAFPYLNDGERELLMSSMCETCYDYIFIELEDFE